MTLTRESLDNVSPYQHDETKYNFTTGVSNKKPRKKSPSPPPQFMPQNCLSPQWRDKGKNESSRKGLKGSLALPIQFVLRS